MKCMVLGLDGASYELIDPWIESGELPNLRKIKESNIWGDLKSQFPPVTAPNWKCYATGKNPGKLGVFWWENVDWSKNKVYCPDYRSVDNEEIWDHLNQDGKKVSVVNIPTSFPPRKINGYLISGGPDAGDEKYYHPDGVEDLLKEMDYRVRPGKSISNAEDCRDRFEEIVDLIEKRFELVKKILEDDDEIEFVHLTVFFINVLHHFLWDDELVKKAWKTIDDNIGELFEKFGEEWNFIIMSDHGSNEIKDVFNVNTWLEEEGLLVRKEGTVSGFLGKIGLTRSRAVKIAEALRIKDFLLKRLPDSFSSSVPSKGDGVSREAKGKVLNWEESTAVASGQGPVYLNKGKLGENYEKVRDEIIEKLENLKSPLTGRKVVRKIYKKEEVYSGKYFEKAPDLIIDQAPNVHVPGEIGKKKVFEEPGRWSGENKRTGLFGAIGPDIGKGGKRVDVSILDIAPTILHLYDLPVPREMDGQVLKEIFRDGSRPSESEVEYRGESEEKKSIKDKISGLKSSGKI